MDQEARTKGAAAFAAAFAETFSASLAEAIGSQRLFEIFEEGGIQPAEGAPIQFRLTMDGGLSGECFVEFYEPQVEAFLTRVIAQPVEAVREEDESLIARIMTATAKSLSKSTLASYGSISCKVEPISDFSFGGLMVVPIASTETQPEMHVQLYFGAPLLTSLAFPFEDGALKEEGSASAGYNLNLVMDVELNLSLRFGQRQLPLRDVLDLASGSVIELDRMVDEPVELYLDGKLIARGEAVVVDGNYGLRVTEIPQPLNTQLLN